MSTTMRRPLQSADALRRYATLVAGDLEAQAALPGPAAADGIDTPPTTPAPAPAAVGAEETDGSLDAAVWWAAHELRPSPAPAGGPGRGATPSYRDPAAPGPTPETRLDRRG
jgi:hypothetical protein